MPAPSEPARSFPPMLRLIAFVVAAALALVGLMGASATGGTSRPGLPGCATPPVYGFAVNTDGQTGSGGRAVAYRPGGRRVTDPAVTSRAPDARLLHTGFGGWEPTLGIRADGTMFYAARNSNLDPTVIRSTDHGATWQSATPCTHTVSLDPYLWLDPDTGRVFDSDIGAQITCSPVSYSDDSGDSWLTGLACGEADNQIVFGGPPPPGGPAPIGYANVVYYCAIGITSEDTTSIKQCSKSLDGGLSWIPTGEPAFTQPSPLRQVGLVTPACGGGVGHHGAVDRHGTVFVPAGWCGPPYVAISEDEGGTWTRVRVAKETMAVDLGEYASQAAIAVDARDNAYEVWVDGNLHVKLAVSRDAGRTWRKPMDVTPPGVTRTSLPSIDVGSPGNIALAFIGTRDPKSTPEAATTWDGYIAMSADALAANPTFYAAPVNNPRTNPLQIGECGEIRCGSLGDFFEVVIGPDGTPWAALVDGCPDLTEGHCGTTAIVEGALTQPRGEAIVGHLVGGPSLR